MKIFFFLLMPTLLALTIGMPQAQTDLSEGLRQYSEGQAANDRGDYSSAMRIWRNLADKGDSYSQYAIGDMYLKGKGVKQDPSQAQYWLHRAASAGVVDAQVSLGAMYMRGLGIPVNEKEGLRWTLAAANCDNSGAQWNMALVYANGMGVVKDMVQSLKWTYLAAQAGRAKTPHPSANAGIKQIERSLSQRDIDQAKRLAFEWRMSPQCKLR
ncbi:MAG: tetratricopeptide repeat protein [Burkholderiales bacterium]